MLPFREARCRLWFLKVMASVVAALMVATVVAPGGASADPAAVESLIRQGVELRKKGKDLEALTFFKKAYDMERSPRAATQLGFCEVQLGYWLAAERHLTEALSATRNPWLAKNEAVIRNTLKQVQASIGELEIAGSPSGAAVEVNGQPAGVLPLAKPVRVPEGVAQVVLRAAGYTEASTSMLIEGGKRAQVKLSLSPAPAPTAAAPAATGAKSDRASPAKDRPRTRSADPSATSPVLRNVAWAATIGSAAAAGMGFYGLYTRNKYGRQFDNFKVGGASVCYTSAKNKGGYDCPNIHNKMKFAEKLMIGSFIASGVLAAGAVAGFMLSSPADDDSARGSSEVSFQLGDGQTTPVGMAWTLVF